MYILISYIQGLAELEIASLAIKNGDITRAGYLKALSSLKGWNAGGMLQPLDFTKFPYESGSRTRILKPDFEKGSWTIVSDYAESK